jgi:hypothetical protein
MTWLIYDLETGAELRRSDAAEPELAEGEAAALIPPSAQIADPLSEWVPERRGFFDIPRLGSDGLISLFTTEELAAMNQQGSVDVLRLLIALLLVRKPIRATDPLFVAGVQQAAAANFLTAPRAAAILSFTPPEA